MEDVFGTIAMLVFLGMTALAQWITQTREARRQSREAREPETPSATPSRPTPPTPRPRRRRVVMVDGPDGPIPRVLEADEPMPGQAPSPAPPTPEPRGLRGRHLPAAGPGLEGRHLRSELARPAPQAPAAAPAGRDASGRGAERAPILPRRREELRNALIHVDLLGPPLALRRRKRDGAVRR